MRVKSALTVQKHNWRGVLYWARVELTQLRHPHFLFPSAALSTDHSEARSDCSVYPLFFFLHLSDVEDEGCWAVAAAQLTHTCCVVPKKTQLALSSSAVAEL